MGLDEERLESPSGSGGGLGRLILTLSLRIMRPWSKTDHPVGEGKKASRVGPPSATTTATMEKSSTSVWLLILPISRVGSKAAWRGSVRIIPRRSYSSETYGRTRPRGKWL